VYAHFRLLRVCGVGALFMGKWIVNFFGRRQQFISTVVKSCMSDVVVVVRLRFLFRFYDALDFMVVCVYFLTLFDDFG
jgi:hypothetical protein